MNNFELSPIGYCSQALIALGINNFDAAIQYVQQLPYGRNSKRSAYSLIIQENRGTCSTKHAFLKAVAQEQRQEHIDLIIGMYKMHEHNTPGVGQVLKKAKLDWIPEAHCYLKVNNQRLDITKSNSNINHLLPDILEEQSIVPDQIGDFKVSYHQAYMRQWSDILEHSSYSFDELWTIREACIAALSE